MLDCHPDKPLKERAVWYYGVGKTKALDGSERFIETGKAQVVVLSEEGVMRMILANSVSYVLDYETLRHLGLRIPEGTIDDDELSGHADELQKESFPLVGWDVLQRIVTGNNVENLILEG